MTVRAGRLRGAVRVSWIVVVAAAVVLLVGIAWLFRARFDRGDVYPHYSSLRRDPLGTSLLLAGYRAAGVDTERRFRDLHRAQVPDGTCFVIGSTWGRFEFVGDREWASLLSMVDDGGRLVIGLTGRQGFLQRIVEEAERADRERRRKESSGDEKEDKTDDASSESAGDEEPEASAGADIEGHPEPTENAKVEKSDARPLRTKKEAFDDEDRGTPLPKLFGLQLGDALDRDSEDGSEAETYAVRQPTSDAIGTEDLPARLAWHERVTLDPEAPEWRVVYAVDKRPVVVERTWGRGSIVVLASSYPLSNEAMVVSREPELLVWLLGNKTLAIFDETHLGVMENRGIAVLARRYGLTHAAVVLLAVVLLHVWRSRSSLLPRRVVDADAGSELSGRDAASGLINLLRRTVGGDSLFESCVREFKNSAAWRRLAPERRKRLDALAEGAGADPVARVRAAHEILSNPS